MDPATFHLDHGRCSAVVRSKDRRFDGWFVTAVLSTRIYCRPSCPAVTPKVVNMSFYRSSAAAQAAGFRACKRCRPDATPGSPEWHVRGDVVARAVRLVADGVVEREGVTGLSARLGYSTRHLERLVGAELGAGPLALARAQRAQTARVLVESTTLPMAEVAYAAGFSSIRSFNDTIRAVYAATPSQLRAASTPTEPTVCTPSPPTEPTGCTTSTPSGPGRAVVALRLRLPFREPLHAPSLFGHLVATAVPGVEVWRAGRLSRALLLPHGAGVVHLTPPAEGERHVEVDLRLEDVRDLTAAIQRCRRLLDLDADPEAVDAHLGQDPLLRPLVARTPGVRLPGSVDAVELALRTVLGQQISTARAGALGARLVESTGRRLPATLVEEGGPTRTFPTAQDLAAAPEEAYPGMPRARRQALRAIASASVAGDLDLSPAASWTTAREQLLRLPGVGPWTAEMVALRGLSDPDAFPATDLGVRVAAESAGLPATSRALASHAGRWRPWRSYATQLLWASSDHAAARLPQSGTDVRTVSGPVPATSKESTS